MIFEYKGQKYNTAKSSGEQSTNLLQVTEDKELQRAVIDAWYDDKAYVDELLAHNELQIIFNYALTMARYQDIMTGVTGERLTKAGTYPDWVVDSADEYHDDMVRDSIDELIEDAENDEEALANIKKAYSSSAEQSSKPEPAFEYNVAVASSQVLDFEQIREEVQKALSEKVKAEKIPATIETSYVEIQPNREAIFVLTLKDNSCDVYQLTTFSRISKQIVDEIVASTQD